MDLYDYEQMVKRLAGEKRQGASAAPHPESFVHKWRRAIYSPAGPHRAMTRHVLAALSNYMQRDGSSAFPSQARLAADTALSVRSVKAHLALAEHEGWIRRKSRGPAHRYGTDYLPFIPAKGASPAPKEAGARPAPNAGLVQDMQDIGASHADIGAQAAPEVVRNRKEGAGGAQSAAMPAPSKWQHLIRKRKVADE